MRRKTTRPITAAAICILMALLAAFTAPSTSETIRRATHLFTLSAVLRASDIFSLRVHKNFNM
jgi:hypothetical protein